MFWTAAIPDDSVSVNFAAGKAEMNVSNLAIRDYGNIPTAVGPNFDTAFVPASVSFDVVWSGPISRRVNVKDAANGFAGNYVEENVGNAVTINWSASNSQGFSFTAIPGNLSTSVAEAGPFAELGQERNGIFFPGGSTGELGANSPAALRLSADQPAADTVGLARLLVDSAAAQARANPTVPRTLDRAETNAATPAGKNQSTPPASALAGRALGVAHPRAVDHVFANLPGSALANDLHGDELSADVG